MKQLKEFISEKLHIGKAKTYKYFPKTIKELRDIIKDKLEETKTNPIDLSDINIDKFNDFSNLFQDLDPYEVNFDWDVSKIKNMSNMFANCPNLQCDISKWNVSNVIDMSGMFYKCKKFNSDISNWDVSKVKRMNSMFCGCIEFNQDLSSWDVFNVKDMERMFYNCKSLKQNFSEWEVNDLTDFDYMFKNSGVDIKQWPVWYGEDE